MIIHNPILTGSFTVNGTDVASITSSAASITAINAYTASQNILNGTYATTSSNTFAGIQTVNSNLVVTGSITAQTLVVQTITSSVIYSSGSNVFGNNIANTQTFTGSMNVSGSSNFSGSVTATDLIVSDTYANDPLIKLVTTTSGNVEVQLRTATTTYNAGIGVVTSGYDFSIFSNNTARLTATSGGDLQIPVGKYLQWNAYSDAASRSWAIRNNETAVGDFAIVSSTNNSNTVSAVRMTITPTGNVGIGISSPFNKLTVNTGTGNNLDIFDTGTSYGIGMQAVNGNNTAYKTWDFYATKFNFITGVIGMGTGASSVIRLLISGADNTSGNYGLYVQNSTGTAYMYVRNDGYLYSSSAWSGSDRRLKENITDLNNGLNKVLGLKARKFDFINGFKNQYGFIAQEVQEVIPNAVSVFQEEDQMLAVKMDFIIPHLVKAIQELKSQNDDLQAQITELKNK
jgi:hypothetical protein